MKQKYLLGIVICTCFWAVYAADSLITYISGWQQSSLPGSSGKRVVTLSDTDMSFINKNNDSILAWDYFSGYYYDPEYWIFQMDASPETSKNVQMTSIWVASNLCAPWYNGYKLSGYSYNPDFWFMNFNYDSNHFVYACIPQDPNDDTLFTTLSGSTYSPYIGSQRFDGIVLDSSVDRGAEHDSDGRYLKVDGIASSENSDSIDAQFDSEVRVLGQITKATLRKSLQEKVYTVIKNATISNGSYNVSNLWASTWWSGDGTELMNGKVLYFWNVTGRSVEVSGNNNISGEKTLVVEWGNIYITWNIRWAGMLWFIALSKNGQWGNIYIHPDVTDIHAFMYADRSLLSARDSNVDGTISSWEEYDGDTTANMLSRQLYIFGSVFSENTIAWALTTKCPYFITTCDDATSKKYDLNYLRRYILVQDISDPSGPKIPQFGWLESYMGNASRTDNDTQKPGYRKYPLIIEYNSNIQQTPPPFFN